MESEIFKSRVVPFVVVGPFLSHVQLFATLWTDVRQSSLSFSISEFAEIHVHWVGDAMQTSHPLLSPSLTLSLSQYKCLFQWIRYLYQVTKVLDLHLQHQSFQWTFSWCPLGLTGLISLLSKGLSRVFSITTFKSVNSPVFSLLYGPTLTSIHDYWKNHSIDYMDLCWQSNVSAF